MTDNLSVHSPESVFPGPVRHRPELFITEKGRIGVYYLVDHLLQAVCWGYDPKKPGSLSIDVKTDGTLTPPLAFALLPSSSLLPLMVRRHGPQRA